MYTWACINFYRTQRSIAIVKESESLSECEPLIVVINFSLTQFVILSTINPRKIFIYLLVFV